MIQKWIHELVCYGLATGLVASEDEVYTVNRLLELFGETEYTYPFGEGPAQEQRDAWVARLPEILRHMLDYGQNKGLLGGEGVVWRDLFDTKIMGCLVGRPGEIIRCFWEKYARSPEAATDFFYQFSQDTDYIRRYRICLDEKWVTRTPVQTGEGSQSHCTGPAGRPEQLPQMSAL